MTFQRPAYEQVTIAHGGHTVTLRPSLRAAAKPPCRAPRPDGNFSAHSITSTLRPICEIILTHRPAGTTRSGFWQILTGSRSIPS